ncbi:unnamed protein product [Gongylonema pulchrum]|uniref:MsrB domain-containing protein n=1 Tax=Gongylonema pulchrum TaxID=637853 RepID=A0A183DCX5_9BILA|nr:unnamed protein product [Gongylonema pulchrum]
MYFSFKIGAALFTWFKLVFVKAAAFEESQSRESERKRDRQTEGMRKREIVSIRPMAVPERPLKDMWECSSAERQLMTERSSRIFFEENHNGKSFEVVALSATKHAAMCASCGVLFSPLAPAPEDVVVRRDDYYDDDDDDELEPQAIRWRKPQYSYMHCRLHCILSRYHYFRTAEFLRIESGTRRMLQPCHLKMLKRRLNYDDI